MNTRERIKKIRGLVTGVLSELDKLEEELDEHTREPDEKKGIELDNTISSQLKNFIGE